MVDIINNFKKQMTLKLDLPMLALIFFMVGFGLITLYSASYASGYYLFGDSLHFVSKQFYCAIFGIIVMIGLSCFDYHYFRSLMIPLYIATCIMLVAVYFFPAINGAHRWIDLGFTNFQPSELAKFVVIVCFAHIGSRYRNEMKNFKEGVIYFLVAISPIVLLVVFETHLSATIIILAIGVALMLLSGTDLKWFVGFVVFIIVVGAVAFTIKPDLVPVAFGRVTSWIASFEDITQAPYQTQQGMLAIGSGGLFGLGLGNSRQKYLYVPEPANDFIFSIICEELGFIGGIIVIALFLILFFRGAYISLFAKDRFGALMSFGIVFQIALQALLNIAVVTNTVPNTGISLPLFSHGGTSLIVILCELGVLLNISRHAKLEKV